MPLIDGDFAELLHAVATGRLAEIEPPQLRRQARNDGHRRREGISGHARQRRRDSRHRGGRAGRRRHRLSRRHRTRRAAGWSPRAGGCWRSRPSPTVSPMRGRALIARSTRSTSPTASTAATSAGASWSGTAHERAAGAISGPASRSAWSSASSPAVRLSECAAAASGDQSLLRRERRSPSAASSSPRRSGTDRSARADRFTAQVERTARPASPIMKCRRSRGACIAVR